MIRRLFDDTRHAVASVLHQGLGSVLVIVMLGLGIGGSTAVFAVFNGLFLRPLPFPEGELIVDVDETAPDWNLEYVAVAMPDLVAWRDDNTTLEAIGAYQAYGSANLATPSGPERVQVARVNRDVPRVLRIEATQGRTFTNQEDTRGGPAVVMLTDAAWRERFGADPDVLGSSLSIDSVPHTVVGVLPPSASFLGDADVWVPLAEEPTTGGENFGLNAVARLRRGVTPAAAQADLTRVHKARIEERSVNETTSPVVAPIRDRLLGQYRAGVGVMLVAVLLVLLIACVNASALMLAHAAGRQRELAIRIAMGASRSRLTLMLLLEGLVLASGGGLLGAVLGIGGARMLRSSVPERALPGFVDFDPDPRFFLFAAALVLGSALVFALAPARRSSRLEPQRALAAGGGSRASAKLTGLRGLVVAEVALATLLLVGALLTLHAYRGLAAVDPGYDATDVATFSIALPSSVYEDDVARLGFWKRYLEELGSLPGTQKVGAIDLLPLGGHTGTFFKAEGAPERGPDDPDPVVLLRSATSGYFDALGIELLAGRNLDDRDGRPDGPRVIVVNESFVDQFWPGTSAQQAVDRRVDFRSGDEWFQVVGVTQDVRHYGAQRPMRPGVYLPYQGRTPSSLSFVVRSSLDLEVLLDQVRTVTQRLDPQLPLWASERMTDRLRDSTHSSRLASWLIGIFSATALVLALGGLFGVLRYAIAARRRELCIRMAVGAGRQRIALMIVGQAALIAGIGLLIGLAGAFAVARGLSGMLTGLAPADPYPYALTAALVFLTALIANLFSAIRAARLEPATELRKE